jgi:hypothetical protein
MRRACLTLAVLAAGCNLPGHQNPFDPATPTALQARATLAGKATLEPLGSAAAQLAGITVNVLGAGDALTDAQGDWHVEGVAPGTYTIQFRSPGYEDSFLTGVVVTLNDGDQIVAVPDVRLGVARGEIAGRVTLEGEADGAYAGISVTLSSQAGAVFTDASGSFRISGVPEGSYALSASRLGYHDPSPQPIAVVRDQTASVPDIQLAANAGALAGAVLVLGAADSSGVTVRARGTTLAGSPLEQTISTPADGRYSLAVPAGTYNVSYELASYATATTAAAVSPGSTVTLASVSLQRDTGSVAGTATLEGKADSSGIQVALTPAPTAANPNPSPTAAAVTDASGLWHVDSVPVGPYAVSFMKQPGYAARSAQVTVVSHAVVTMDPVALAATPGIVQGKVLLEGRAAGALDGTTVRIEGTTLATATLADGRYVIDGAGAGAAVVLFERAGFETQRAQIVVAPGETLALFDVTLSISRGAVSGRFTLQGAASSAGIVVSTSGATSVTDADGAFTLTGLPVGTYALSARKDPDWQPQTVSGVVVAAGASTALPGSPVALQPEASATLSGTALLEGAPDASGTTVTLSGADFRGTAVSATQTTAASGAFSFGALRAGSYALAFSHASFDSPAAVGASVITGQSTSLGTLTLAASRGSASGIATASGAADLSGTVVTISGGPDAASAVTDAAGRFRVDRLRVGSGYIARYARPAYSGATVSFTVAANATADLGTTALALATGGKITGLAKLERPAAGPFAGIGVALSGRDVNGAAVSRTASTAADGSYTLDTLPQGTYGLTFSKAAYDAQTSSGIFVAAGASVPAPTVTLPVSQGTVAGSISLTAGTVAGFDVGTDFSGVVVTLAGTDVPVPSAVTDRSGAYRFDAVPVSLAGSSFTVAASKPFFQGASAAVLAAANATVQAAALALPIAAGSASGTARITNVVGGTDALDSAGIAISVSGTAFNGSPFSTGATSAKDGTWATGALPPGTYDVSAAVTGWRCGAYPRIAVASGAATPVGSNLCLDTTPPAGLVLGAPVPSAGALAGYTAASTAVVPIVTQASDGTLPPNFKGYQVVVGASPDWSKASSVDGTPASLTFSLVSNAANVLWARPVDTAGNAGTATNVQVIQDSTAPPAPAIGTPRDDVDGTTTSVTLTGSESGSNFDHYVTCQVAQPATSSCSSCACPTTGACTCGSGGSSCSTWTAQPATFALSLAQDQKTCLWARGVDAAGNGSAVALKEVVSDMAAPPPPTVVPQFDPNLLTVRADYVDFFVTGIGNDSPAGTTAWDKIAWLEMDSGSGFSALCPQASCHAGNLYRPCACGCTDSRLLCNGTSFVGLRLPLLGGLANQFSIRAVDVAGNTGAGVGQQVNTSGLQGVISNDGSVDEGVPRLRGTLLTYLKGSNFTLVDLGTNARYDAADPSCTLGSRGPMAPSVSAEAAGPTLVAHATAGAKQLVLRKPGADGKFCTADDTTTAALADVTGVSQTFIQSVSASGVRVAWVEDYYGPTVHGANLRLREPGPNGVLDVDVSVDDVTSLVASTSAGYLFDVQIAGKALVYRVESCTTSCTVPGTTYLVIANASGNFAGQTPIALSTTANSAALSADGTELVLAEGTVLSVRQAGADGVLMTADDTTATRAALGTSSFQSATVDGPHVVATEWGSGGQLVHWYAGGNGLFEASGDDVVARMLPSSTTRVYPSLGSGLSSGYLVYQVGQIGLISSNPDVMALDLTTLRWETVGTSDVIAVATDGGTLFYRNSGGVYARTSDGRTTGPQSFYTMGGATGNDLVATTASGLMDHGPGVDGLWFTADDPTPAVIHAGSFGEVATGEGKAAAYRDSGTAMVPYVYEPSTSAPAAGTGPLRGATAVLLDAAGLSKSTSAYLFQHIAVSAKHVFWTCGTWPNLYVCYRYAGANGKFDNVDDVSGQLLQPPTASSPYAPYWGSLGFHVSGNRVGLVDNNLGVRLLNAGPDGKFNIANGTGDDFETVLGLDYDSNAFALAGNYLAYSAAGTGGGTQITVMDLARGGQRQLTSHYSAKNNLALDPSGRLYWIDRAFANASVFLFAP